jgi:hypothetical protein
MLGGILRTVLAAGMASFVAWLAKHGFAIESTQAEQMVTWITGILLIAGWSVWQKVWAHRLINTGASAANLTVAQVENRVSDGLAPSVLTPKDAIPMPPIVVVTKP